MFCVQSGFRLVTNHVEFHLTTLGDFRQTWPAAWCFGTFLERSLTSKHTWRRTLRVASELILRTFLENENAKCKKRKLELNKMSKHHDCLQRLKTAFNDSYTKLHWSILCYCLVFDIQIKNPPVLASWFVENYQLEERRFVWNRRKVDLHKKIKPIVEGNLVKLYKRNLFPTSTA